MIFDNTVKVDDIDLNIIQLLNGNGRIQNNEIASRLNISEGTVRNRIKKLIDAEFLTIRGLVNPSKIKNRMIIFLGVQLLESKNLEKAADYFKHLNDVIAVYVVTGRFDMLIEIFIEPYKLLNFLSVDLANGDYIASTESFVTLKAYKKWI